MPTVTAKGNGARLVAATITPLHGYWRESKDGNPVGYALYRRHYSAAKNPRPKIRQFVGPGEKFVLLGSDELALFAWRKFYDASGQQGVNCAVFRNESSRLSSDLISEAVSWAWAKWPGERLYTYVKPSAIRSTNPGCCFKAAGWRECGRTQKGLLIFEKLPPAGDGECAAAFAATLNHGGEEHRAADLRKPLATVTGANDARALVAALVTKHYGGVVGHGVEQPVGSVTGTDHHALTVAYLSHFYTSNTAGGHGDPEYPAKCITSGGQHAAVTVAMLEKDAGAVVCDRRKIVAAFIDTYYGNSKEGGSVDQPSPTVVSKDRISLVTVTIDGTTYVVTDIAMRMLTPKELLLAQGFPADYRVDRTSDNKPVSKADQVKLIGNAVPPPFARALAFANVVEQGVLSTAPQRKAVAS
jgi:hypothetical protein